MRNIAFRVDASVEIGSGHVMRCLTLADALGERGYFCHFVCRDLPGNMSAQIRARGHVVQELTKVGDSTVEVSGRRPPLAHSSWLGVNWELDAEQSRQALDTIRPEWVVVDHYALDAEWESAAVPIPAQLLVLDDLADRKHNADILLDQNLGRSSKDYDGLVPDRSLRLIGPEYALIRPEFALSRERALARRGSAEVERVFVSMGGMDKDNSTGKILDILAQGNLPTGCRISVTLSSRAPWLEAVAAQAKQMHCKTDVLVDATNIAELMADADLAIGAGGSTAWERCCLGLPTVVLILAENQAPGARALEKAGAAVLVGRIEDFDWEKRFIDGVMFASQPSNLASLSAGAAEVCDGMGAERVTRHLTEVPVS